MSSLVAFFSPPSGVLGVYILACITLLMGLFLAWAWGTVVMIIAIAVQDKAAYHATVKNLGEQARKHPNPASWAQIAVYNGAFLDSGTSAVYLAFGILFIYLMV